MSGIRDHSELGIGNELESLKGVFKANKIVISDGDDNVSVSAFFALLAADRPTLGWRQV